MDTTPTKEFEQAITIAMQLSTLEKVRLMEQLMGTLSQALSQEPERPKRSLYGSWSDVSISAEDIDEARREMWGNFPREDI